VRQRRAPPGGVALPATSRRQLAGREAVGLHSRFIHVDNSRVSKRFQIALLATAALASMAVASVRITHAARSGARNPQIPVYGTTPAAEAATLQALHVPAGFQRFPHCAAGDACFIRRKPIALEVAPVRRLGGSSETTSETRRAYPRSSASRSASARAASMSGPVTVRTMTPSTHTLTIACRSCT
jgi:hypothetical protein